MEAIRRNLRRPLPNRHKNPQEQELKQKNLQERVEMAAEHKTGSVHSLYIRHLEQQQEV